VAQSIAHPTTITAVLTGKHELARYIRKLTTGVMASGT